MAPKCIARYHSSIPVLYARRRCPVAIEKLAARCASATTPLLIRGLPSKPAWRASMDLLGDRAAFIQNFGDERALLR
jgi:hypothetical protein